MLKNLKGKGIRYYYNLFRNRNKFFITSHKRPKFSQDCNLKEDEFIRHPKIGIVIQGPILKKDDFTLETIKLYKKIFRDKIIILSTWEDEDKEYLQKIKNEQIEIILNKYPANRGISNINLQIVSSFAGVLKIKELGVDYVVKTRTDQRIYNPNSLGFMYNLISNFLPNGNLNQKKRILGISLNTFFKRPYGISDMLLFGYIDDMYNYWSLELDERKKSPEGVNNHNDLARARLCEVYLSANYLEKIGRELKWTLKDSFRTFKNHFIIIDSSSIDLFWYKYEYFKEFRYLKYGDSHKREISFLDWYNNYLL